MADDGETNSEHLAVRFEKSLEKRHPFTFPVIIMGSGFAFFFIIWFMSLGDILTNHPALDPFVLLEYPLSLDYITATVLYFGFILFMMFISYIAALIPMTLFIILGSKGMMAFGLSQDITEVGEKFGGIQLVFRSMLPGLFGIGIGLGALSVLFPLTPAPITDIPLSFNLILTLFFGAQGLFLGMALFPATWFADDSGLVIQGRLTTPYREPPRVDGAGNWLRSVFAGLTVFLYPLTMIQGFILTPYLNGALSLLDLVIGVFVTVIGMPLAMMSLSLPFVLLTEKLQPRLVKGIRFVANKLGAKDIVIAEPTVLETSDETIL